MLSYFMNQNEAPEMDTTKIRYYPTGLQAIHLVILYMFIQTVVDFPLAMIDYYKDTEYLYNPLKKIVLGIGSVLFILYYGYRKSNVSLKEVFPLKKFNPLLIILIITFFWGIQNILNVVNAQVEKLIPPPSWFWELFNKVFESDYGWLGAFVKVAVIAPVVEELIFRGVIMRGFIKNYPGWLAVFYSALIFALFHLNPWQFPATFILGLLLGWLMLAYRSILLCIIGHSINNLMVLLTMTFWDKLKDLPLFAMEKKSLLVLSLSVAVLSVLLMAILYSRKVRRKNLQAGT